METVVTLKKTDLGPRLSLILLCLLILGTVFIYTYNATITPPGVLSDNVYNLSDALRISRGIAYPWVLGFRAAVVGRGDDPEIFYRFLLGGWFKLAGADVFQALVLQVFINLITVALTFKAGLMLLRGQSWRRLGSLFAASTIGASMLLMFFSHKPERPILVPPVVLGAFIALLSASRTQKARSWFLGGFLSMLGVHTYTAGLVTPVWAVTFVGYQFIVGLIERKPRLKLRNVAWMALGAVPPLLAWAALLLYIPDLYFRVGSVSGSQPLTMRALQGLATTFVMLFVQGNDWWAVNYNAAGAPLLSAIPSILVLIGVGAALWRWRRPESFLLVGGVLLFSLPSALSIEPKTPFRLIGVLPLLALLAGQGLALAVEFLTGFVDAPLSPIPFPPRKRRERGAFVFKSLAPLAWEREALAQRETGRGVSKPLNQTHRLSSAARTVLLCLALLVMPLQLATTHLTFQSIFADPAAHPDQRVEELYNKYFIQSLKWLANVDQPTYVPLWILDNPIAAFFVQNKTFTNVSTWSRYGLKELPPGQYFMPDRWYGTRLTHDESVLRALLLPQSKTIIILPISGLPSEIAGPPPLGTDDMGAIRVIIGTSQVSEVKNADGQVIGYTRPVSGAGFSPPSPTLEAGERAPAFGNGLRLLLRQPMPDIQPGKTVAARLEWLVTAPQPADDFSTLQVIEPNFFAAYGSTDHAILPFLYPSAMWQPGDIIPDEHIISIPPNLADGVYRWGIGVYVPPRGSRFEITRPDDFSYPQLHDLWIEDAIRLNPPPMNTIVPAQAIPIQASVGDYLTLVAYQASIGKDAISVTLYWRVKARPTGDYTIFIHAEQDGKLVSTKDEQPFSGQYPTVAWRPGEVVTTSHSLPLPADQPGGLSKTTTLLAGMYDYPSFQRLPVVQNNSPRQDGRVVLGILNPAQSALGK